MLEWVRSHDQLLWWLGLTSVITFALGVFLVPLLVVRMPADFFVRKGPPADSFRGRHPVVRIGSLVLRNLLGLALVLAGIAMLVLPGQGILTILTITDTPRWPMAFCIAICSVRGICFAEEISSQ